MKRILLIILALSLILLLTGCSSLHPVNVRVQGHQRMNLDHKKHSLPVIVKIFQLKRRQAFDTSQFRQLWKKPKAALGDDLVSSYKIHISPGQNKTITIDRKENTHYIAALAIFRHPASHNWRASTQITQWSLPYVPQHIHVDVVNNKINIQ